MTNQPQFVYVIYIASSPDKIWRALTDPDMTERYWLGNRIESGWKPGSPVTLKRAKPKVVVSGVLLACEPQRLLSYSFHPEHDGLEKEKPSRVTFEIEKQGDQVKLTLTHDEFEPGSKVFEGISRGWPLTMSSLKSLLETGRTLTANWYQEKLKREAKQARQQ
jgi:uncharacterized protein YndB with AHSA1/START domain